MSAALAANELTIGCSPSCTVAAGTAVTFTASLTADGTKPSTANWDFNGDGLYDQASGNPVQESFDKAGSYTIETETSLNCKPVCTGQQKLTVVGPPVPVTGDATVAGLSATLNGTVNPEGNQVTDCHFDYGPTINYGSSVPCGTNPGAGNGAVPVSAAIGGLVEGTTYHFRLVAANEVTSGDGGDRAFSIAPNGFTVGVSGPTGPVQIASLIHVTASAIPAAGRHIVAYLWSLHNPHHVDLDTGTRPFLIDQVGSGTQHVWVRAEDSTGSITPDPAEYTINQPHTPAGCESGLTPPTTFGWMRITAPDCIRHVAATAHSAESYVIDVPNDGIDINGLNVYCQTSSCSLTIIGAFGPLPRPGSETPYYVSSSGPLGLRMLNTPDGIVELGSAPISFFWTPIRGQLVRSFLSVRLTSGETLAGTPLTGTGHVALTAPGADGLPGIQLTVETSTTLLGSNATVPVTMHGDSDTEIQSAGNNWSIPLDGLNIPPLFWINHGSLAYTPADPRVGGGGTYEGHVEASFYLVHWEVGADLVFHLDAGHFVFDSGGFSLDHNPDGEPDTTSPSDLTPIGLDHLDAHLQINPFLDLGGGLTVTAGPFHIGGSFEFAATHTDPSSGAAVPFQLAATGTIPIPIASANLTVGILVTGDPSPGFGISGEISVDWDVATIDGRLYGYFAGGGGRVNFEFGGSVGVKVLGIDIAGGAGFVNNDWIAGCGHLLFISGWAVHSFHGAGDNSGFGGCDNIAPYSIAPQLAHLSGVRAGAAAATGWRINVPKRAEWANLQLKANGAPPRFHIVGPGLNYTTTGRDGLKHSGEVYVLSKATAGVTLIGLHFPREGKYTVTPVGTLGAAGDGGQPKVTAQQSFSTASAISARVLGRGDARRLSYSVAGPRGQRVTFYERAAHGEALIGTVVNGHGRLSFHPGQFGGRARTIVAFPSVEGMPRGTHIVAHYKAPPLDRVGKPLKLRLVYREGRADVIVRWLRVAGAPNYVVGLHSSDGRNVSFIVKRQSFDIPAVAPGDRLRVTVRAHTILGRTGAAARATLRVPRQSRPKKS